MAFTANPLALSVSDPAFESWLREGGYLEILDRRTRAPSSSSPSASSAAPSASATVSTAAFFFEAAFSYIWTLLSLLTLNPFAKLAAEDFSGDTPPWTVAFIGSSDSYSLPSSPSQARMRVHENLKRYARNYASLFVLFFACALYQLPIALVGLLSCLALWEAIRLCGDRWGLHQHPAINQCLVCVAQVVAVLIMFFCNVQFALFCAVGVSYTAMLLHAAFRKLTPTKLPAKKRRST